LKTLHKCKAQQIQVGDVLIRNESRWDVIQIEEERYGLEIRLRNNLGDIKSKFMLSDEIVTIEL
jgi:hypothetical protein